MLKKTVSDFGVLTALALALALLSNVGTAEQAITTEAAPAAPTSKVVGAVDLRPSMRLEGNSFHTENALELGYQFAPGRIMTYVQYFETNLHNPDPASEGGLSPTFYDGYLRTRLSKLLEDKDAGLSFSYQSRVFLPTSTASRDKSMIATFRNYLTVSKELNKTVTITFSELPIFGVYSRPGVVNAAGVTTANMAYENRLYLITDINISEKLSLSLPLFFHNTKARSMPGAANDGAWTHLLWTYPELTYSLGDNTSLGLAYYSDNLVAKDLSGVNIVEGLKAGTVQLVLGATL